LSADLEDVSRALQQVYGLGALGREEVDEARGRIRFFQGLLDARKRSICHTLQACISFLEEVFPNQSAEIEKSDESGWES
jgi:hypothetical protein